MYTWSRVGNIDRQTFTNTEWLNIQEMKGVFTMTNYDYMAAMKEDIQDYINYDITLADYDSRDELEEHLNEELWTVDGVTGNASGSYTFNTYEAEENIAHNWDLLEEAISEFGGDVNPIKKGAEWCDVTIRCYLLGQAIGETLDAMKDELEEAFAENDQEEE